MNWSKIIRFAVFLALTAFLSASTSEISNGQEPDSSRFGLVIHGEAGFITPESLSEERQAAYRAKLQQALHAGYDVLNQGGSSVDAVVAAITIMEDSPLFNAGKGAVLTNAGTAELDASIMDGETLNAGAVASVKRVRSPITLARLVMEESRHVMLIGDGAEAFAKEQGMEMVSNQSFLTPRRVQQYERYREQADDGAETGEARPRKQDEDIRKLGTVGAAALDREGNLAAGTSTGGISFKRWGRVGDSPIIGAGTYADNATCAISATGDGEYFIRGVIAHDISAMMRYAGLSLEKAANAVIHEKLPKLGGDGGIIGIDASGHVTTTFTTEGMFRGRVNDSGVIEVEMFGQ